MTIEEIRKSTPKERLHEKVKLTKDHLSKIGIQQLNAYKFKRKCKNEVYLEF